MDLLTLVVVLLVVGAVVYLIETSAPIPAAYKRIISTILLVAVLVWILRTFFPGLAHVPIGK